MVDTIRETREATAEEVEAALGRLVGDFAATAGMVLTELGVRLGLWEALAAGPAAPETVAERAGAAVPYVREWLRSQAAAGYVGYDPAAGTFHLAPGVATVLGAGPLSGLAAGMAAQFRAWWSELERYEEAFRTGRGISWGTLPAGHAEGMDLISRAVVAPALVGDWLPALDGAAARLAAGAAVADVGCGFGAPTIAMAEAFPASRFAGFDVDDASVARARKAALAAGVADRVSFDVAAATDVPGGPYDLVTFIDSLHDLGDPEGALRRIRRLLADDGVVLLVEHAGSDHLEDNLHPAGRFFYAAYAALARTLYHSLEADQMARAARIAEHAVDLARRSGDAEATAEALLALHDVHWRPGHAEQRLEVLGRLAEVASRLGPLRHVTRLLRAEALLELGDPSALGEIDAYCSAAHRHGDPLSRWQSLSRRAAAELLTGRLDAATEQATRAAQLAELLGDADAVWIGDIQRWDLARFTGGRGSYRRHRPDSPPPVETWAPWRALILADAGDLDGATSALAGFTASQAWGPGVRCRLRPVVPRDRRRGRCLLRRERAACRTLRAAAALRWQPGRMRRMGCLQRRSRPLPRAARCRPGRQCRRDCPSRRRGRAALTARRAALGRAEPPGTRPPQTAARSTRT